MAKICLNCGSPLEDDAKFCSKCGSAYGAEPVCAKCGHKLASGTRFCPNCGADQSAAQVGTGGDYIKKGFDTFTATINTMAGESGKAEIHLKELYSDVFKRHTQEEKDELFVCGTSKTTPKESEMVAEWPRPWLYSRIFLMFSIVFAGLYVMVMNFGNLNGVPGTMFVGALLVPLTVMMFFWESSSKHQYFGCAFRVLCGGSLFSGRHAVFV
jgi:RsiW-degrading membrane proteinase PrsW (M82 family)